MTRRGAGLAEENENRKEGRKLVKLSVLEKKKKKKGKRKSGKDKG